MLKCLDSLSDILQTWSHSSSIGLTAIPTFLLALLHCIFNSLFLNSTSAPASLALSTNPFGLGRLADRLDDAAEHGRKRFKVATVLRENFGQARKRFI